MADLDLTWSLFSIAAAAVVALGGAYWYSTSNAKPVQKTEVADTVASRAKAGIDAATPYAESAEQKIRSLAGKAEYQADNARAGAAYYSNKVSAAAYDAKADAERLAAKAKWEAEHATSQVTKYGKDWLSWTQDKKDAALSAADRKIRDAENAVYSAEAWASKKLHRGADQASAYGNEAKKEAEATYNSAAANAQAAEKKAEGWFSSTKKSVEQTADEVAAEARAAKNEAVREGRAVYDAAGKKVDQVESKASGWFNSAKGSVEETAEEAKAKAYSLERQASNKGHEIKEDAKASSWLSWGSAKKEEIKGDVRDAASQTQDRVAEAEARARQSINNGVNRAEGAAYRTRADVRDATRDVAADAKAEGSSWFNWFGAKKDEAKAEVSRKADDVRYAATPAQPSQVELMQQQAAIDARNVKTQAQIDAERVRGYTNEKTAEVKETANSWFGFGANKVEDAKDKAAREASGAKDTLKDALLHGEKAVENGAVRAQEQTRKL